MLNENEKGNNLLKNGVEEKLKKLRKRGKNKQGRRRRKVWESKTRATEE